MHKCTKYVPWQHRLRNYTLLRTGQKKVVRKRTRIGQKKDKNIQEETEQDSETAEKKEQESWDKKSKGARRKKGEKITRIRKKEQESKRTRNLGKCKSDSQLSDL